MPSGGRGWEQRQREWEDEWRGKGDGGGAAANKGRRSAGAEEHSLPDLPTSVVQDYVKTSQTST